MGGSSSINAMIYIRGQSEDYDEWAESTSLHVYGIDGLMVADASIMPQVISGNTNTPSMLIAEQAARFILS